MVDDHSLEYLIIAIKEEIESNRVIERIVHSQRIEESH